MRAAFSGVNRNLIIKSGLGRVQSGDILFVKVLEAKDGLSKASIAGKIITVKSSLALEAGKSFRVRALWQNDKLFLLPLKADAEAAGLFEGLYGSGGEKISDAFIRKAAFSGLVIKNDVVRYLRRFLRRRKDSNPEKEGLIIELLKKGLYSESMVETLSGEKEERDDGSSELLFNHLQDKNELWFIVPFDFKAGGTSIPGSIRMKKNRSTGKTEKAVIEVRRPSGKMFFSIDDFSGGSKTLRLASEEDLGPAEKQKIKTGLIEFLDNMSLKIDDNIIENCFTGGGFDGFNFGGRSSSGVEEVV